MSRLTAKRLRHLLDYDQAEGVFRWKNKTHRDVPVEIGDIAGSFHPSSGYWNIWIDKYQYGAHRLAWLYVTGEWPISLVDHRDNDRLNNAFYNLRESNHSQNKANSSTYRKKNSYLPKGVLIVSRSKVGGKQYGAQIRKDGKLHRLGCFYTADEAHQAYLNAAKELHGEFANAGTVIEFKKKA